MTILLDDRKKQLENFSKRFAKTWKNYFSLEGLLPGINPTKEQKQVVQSSEKQLIIRGSAGSGKSLMLVYRLIKMMEQANSPQRILYVTFNQTLIQDTRKRLNQSQTYLELSEKHHVDIMTYHDLVRKILMKDCGYSNIKRIPMTQQSIEKHEADIVSRIHAVLAQVEKIPKYKHMEKLFKTHTAKFLQEEFFWMKANGLVTLNKYMEKERTGRGNSPSVRMRQRPTIFYLFERYNEFMRRNYYIPQLDMEDYALHLLNELSKNKRASFKYDHILVDEFQDLQPMQIKSLVRLTKGTITLVGDEKQRIYKRSPISYKELNLKVNSRTSQRLTRNFRSTKQIMDLASEIKFNDVENVREDNQVFFREGPRPKINYYTSNSRLASTIIRNIRRIHRDNPGKSIAIVHRYSDKELNKEDNLKRRLDLEFDVIGVNKYGYRFDYNKRKKPIFFTSPYEIKGLEFDYVFIIHFDIFHYPLKARLDELNKKYIGMDWEGPEYKKDRKQIINDEKKIFYVACTRAKEGLFIYCGDKKERRISRFIKDFNTNDYESNFNKGQFR
ncbi:UvrD-helicase domain-containing protein [Cerasibacillus terrae]|uniref:UvrD-helicase domain-containing protein n=1 Tax=Cerasibacillus terrae TaxID=2498845 RepID=UPI0017462564|nr:UvrD-helicase domain-containing protein [Cerasibacillus terrae]